MSVLIIKPGTLMFAVGTSGEPTCVVTGWHFAIPGGQASDEAVLEAVLRFVANHYGIALGSSTPAPTFSLGTSAAPLPENFDAQREALDTIAVARWRDDL